MNEGKTKANVEEESLKSTNIPDLNLPSEGKEESSDDEIVLPSKQSCGENEKKESSCIKNSDNQTPTETSSKLLLKGCKACYMFVMVRENDQRCPKCDQGTYLIDI